MFDGEVSIALGGMLSVMLFLIMLIWTTQLRISARLRRIEHQLLQNSAHDQVEEPSLVERKAENRQQKRLFQQFLDEEPYRRNLPKREQFTAFRKWRSEKGLNWSGEDKPA